MGKFPNSHSLPANILMLTAVKTHGSDYAHDDTNPFVFVTKVSTTKWDAETFQKDVFINIILAANVLIIVK